MKMNILEINSLWLFVWFVLAIGLVIYKDEIANMFVPYHKKLVFKVMVISYIIVLIINILLKSWRWL